jgi:hypothetical protein
MTDRIDKYLDGVLDSFALGPDERAQAQTLERVIEETRAFVDARPAPDLTTTVLGKVAQVGSPLARHRPGVLAALAHHLWAPRHVSLRVRPVYVVLAAAAILVVAPVLPTGGRSTPDATRLAQLDVTPKLFVQFRLEAVDASTVSLAGSFTNWQPDYELHQSAPGIWTITLPLSLGVHDYAFIVDGKRWVPDPYAPAVDDGFGGTNSRIALLSPEQPRS